MKINSITRNKDYASWTVNYVHEGVEHTVVVNLNSKTSLLENLDSSKFIPPFAADIIRDELADRGEITKTFFEEAVCDVRPENWTN